MITLMKLLGAALARCQCRLFMVAYFTALGVSHAQSGSFIIPALRGGEHADFAYWDLFRNEPNKNSNHNYDNPPALLDGLGEDDHGNLTSVTAKNRTFLKETATPTCFVTSSGALYSFAAATAFEVRYTPPVDKGGEVTNVIFQTQTGGTRMDVNNIRLVYTGTTPAGPMTFQLAPAFKGLDDPQTGGFSERLVSAFQWNLTGLNVRDFKIVFASPASSMPLWQAQIDAVIGEPFVQELGYLLSTRSRPITRHGRVGSIDKNLAAGMDERFFNEGQPLNLLADPESGWMPTGWYYNGVSTSGSSLPLIFPGQDITVLALFAPQNYPAWREAMFNHKNTLLGTEDDYENDEISLKDVDHDGDGLINAGEYALGGDPYTDDPGRWSPQMLRVDVGGVPHLAIRYRTNGAPVSHLDTVFKAQLSMDGGSTWTDNGTVPTTVEHSRVLQSDGSAFVTARTVLPVSELPAEAAMRIDWTASGEHGVQAPLPLGISTAATLAAGRVGMSYNTTITASGGTGPYLWEVTAGSVPAGLTFDTNTGVLSGIPSTAGNVSFSVQVTDANDLAVIKALQLNVQPFIINTASTLASSLTGVPYRADLTATGGTGPYIWNVSSGTLPAGLSLSHDGVLSGSTTAAAAGTTTFTVQITDANQFTATKQFSVTFVHLVITSAASLPGAVKGIPYTFHFTATGGTADYDWEVTAGSAPPGLGLSTDGVLTGLPASTGTSTFTVRVTDAANFSITRQFSLTTTTNFQKPVINPVTFAPGNVGTQYRHTLTAVNYPRTFTLTGLPKGLAYRSVTDTGTLITICEISGRPAASGVFNVQIRASNDGGTSSIVSAPLVVKALPASLVGTFTGIIHRDAAANGGLGSRLNVTTTAAGTCSVRIITGGKTTSGTGHVSGAAPHISFSIGGRLLELHLTNNIVTGSYGGTGVDGWRSTWNIATKPASSRDGYYSMALDLTNEDDLVIPSIPHGSGFATFTITPAGTVSITGTTADGQKFTNADVLGPQGQIGVCSLIYASKGTLLGQLTVTEDIEGGFLDNSVGGSLTWSKPQTKARVYPAAFTLPVNLTAEGGYHGASAKGIILGLPAAGEAELRFSQGGLAFSSTVPDFTFTYTDSNKVSLGTTNPNKVSLTINAATGAVSGKFTLTELMPPLVRKDITFQGQIVRHADGSKKAAGYFLLPQIPGSGQTAATAPVLSGRIRIEQ